ncbi:preprotein translocase subunit SecE [Bacteroidetes/Chlorobi group bacterium MS-B_bin-24]|jgi:preprotein translocase subunit SecE|nr:MAG: preprotein translocase subunit SecE [Bacteroidetes/Chlorobi group bacterium MS-B_bin-24]
MLGKVKNYLNEVAREMKKVSWPTRAQLRESTYIVIGTMLIFTAFVYLVDLIMVKIMQFIF